MKTINHTCKFCGKPVALKIEDSYAGLGDPFKLLSYAACNSCADLRVKRRTLSSTLIKIAAELLRMSKTARARYRSDIDKLTQAYVKLVNDWTKSAFEWQPEITDAILADPENIGQTLNRIWPSNSTQ